MILRIFFSKKKNKVRVNFRNFHTVAHQPPFGRLAQSNWEMLRIPKQWISSYLMSLRKKKSNGRPFFDDATAKAAAIQMFFRIHYNISVKSFECTRIYNSFWHKSFCAQCGNFNILLSWFLAKKSMKWTNALNFA